MGNMTCSIETTIINMYEYKLYEGISIKCNTDPKNTNIVLKKSHEKYDKLYEMLEKNKTFLFKYEIIDSTTDTYWKIMDIGEPKVRRVNDSVEELRDPQGKLRDFPNTHIEIVLSENNSKRFLIKKNHNKTIIVGNSYVITCTKKFGENFYEILDVTNNMINPGKYQIIN